MRCPCPPQSSPCALSLSPTEQSVPYASRPQHRIRRERGGGGKGGTGPSIAAFPSSDPPLFPSPPPLSSHPFVRPPIRWQHPVERAWAGARARAAQLSIKTEKKAADAAAQSKIEADLKVADKEINTCVVRMFIHVLTETRVLF